MSKNNRKRPSRRSQFLDTAVLLLRTSLGQSPNFGSHKSSMSLPVLAKPVVAKPTSPRPDGITFLGGIALLAGIMLLFAGISLAIPWYPNWTYGPGLVGFWIILCFGYAGFGQFSPTPFLAVIVMLAILYLAAGIGLFSGRRWAWTLGITLALVGVASSILQTIISAQYDFLATPGLIVTLLILIYLMTPLARNFFLKRRICQGLVTGG